MLPPEFAGFVEMEGFEPGTSPEQYATAACQQLMHHYVQSGLDPTGLQAIRPSGQDLAPALGSLDLPGDGAIDWGDEQLSDFEDDLVLSEEESWDASVLDLDD